MPLCSLLLKPLFETRHFSCPPFRATLPLSHLYSNWLPQTNRRLGGIAVAEVTILRIAATTQKKVNYYTLLVHAYATILLCLCLQSNRLAYTYLLTRMEKIE